MIPYMMVLFDLGQYSKPSRAASLATPRPRCRRWRVVQEVHWIGQGSEPRGARHGVPMGGAVQDTGTAGTDDACDSSF